MTRLVLPDKMSHNRAIVIKIEQVNVGVRGRYTDRQKRIARNGPHVYGKLVYNKDGLTS